MALQDTSCTISSDVLRGYNDVFILYTLLEKDSYGYEIGKTIRQQSQDIYIIKETTLYSAFNRLEKNGLIQSYFGEETQGKRRTYFHITEAGKAYYLEKCQEWHLTKQLVNHFIKEME